jgi:multidrug efflux pump subunit AcrA (membrane-fusion protein)
VTFRRSVEPLALGLAAFLATAASAAADPVGQAVTVVEAKQGCFIETLELSGTVAAREMVLVRPDVEGLRIARVMAEDGETVTAGQPLAELVRPDYLPGTPATATIKAAAPGLLIHKTIPVGTPASAQGDPLFRIAKDGDLDLNVEVPQSEFGQLRVGQTARIQTLGGLSFGGTVRQIVSMVDPLTQLGHASIQIRATGVRPGAFAKAAIDTGRSCGATVPLSAILYGAKGALVQVVRDGRVETRPVRVGPFSGSEAQIADGLRTGETIVARAGSFLRGGDAVRAMPAVTAEGRAP